MTVNEQGSGRRGVVIFGFGNSTGVTGHAEVHGYSICTFIVVTG